MVGEGRGRGSEGRKKGRASKDNREGKKDIKWNRFSECWCLLVERFGCSPVSGTRLGQNRVPSGLWSFTLL